MATVAWPCDGQRNHNPQKQAVELVFKGLWMVVAMRPPPPKKTSTTLVFEGLWWWWAGRGNTPENEHDGSFSEVVGGGRLNNNISIKKKTEEK